MSREFFLSKIKLFIFDVDGTLIKGDKPLEYARDILLKLNQIGKQFVILTNNSSFSNHQNRRRIEKTLNLKLKDKNIFSSTQATIEFLNDNNLNRCYILAKPSVMDDFTQQSIVFDHQNPQALVMCFDKTLNYSKIEKFASFLLQTQPILPYIVSHPDKTCPTERGPIPDVGSFIELFWASTKRKPDYILGKPNKHFIESILQKFNVSTSEALIIGDNPHTDIQMAKISNVKSILISEEGTNNFSSIVEKKDTKNIANPKYVWKTLKPLSDYLEDLA